MPSICCLYSRFCFASSTLHTFLKFIFDNFICKYNELSLSQGLPASFHCLKNFLLEELAAFILAEVTFNLGATLFLGRFGTNCYLYLDHKQQGF